MTRKEFSSKYDAFMRYGSRQVILITLPVLGLIVATVLLSDSIEQQYGIGAANIFTGMMLLLSTVGFAAGALWLNRRFVRRFGLLCPGCGRQLTDKPSHRKVLLAGHCPKCQSKVFDEERASDATARMAISTVRASSRSGTRRE